MKWRDLRKACANNKYIIVRHNNGELYGVNCRFALYGVRDRVTSFPWNNECQYQSWYPCGINEYITRKVPLLANRS